MVETLTLIRGMLGYFVGNDLSLTPKGNTIVQDLSTIAHNASMFLAQFANLFPAPEDQWLNSRAPH